MAALWAHTRKDQEIFHAHHAKQVRKPCPVFEMLWRVCTRERASLSFIDFFTLLIFSYPSAGKFSGVTGSTSCQSCPDSSTSPSESTASTDCSCEAGYTGQNGGECAKCPSGTYKAVDGSGDCTSCGVGKNSPQASTSEQDCSAR